MKLNHLLCFLLILSGFALLTTTGSGCANIIPPTGGPRDTLPPVMVNSNPADSTLNFKGKKIVLSFDEYVQLDNVQENLIVSPVPKQNPVIISKLRTITINIKDTLEPNTTFALDFGNAIKDINEGNAYRNFTYVFSTGSHLDSLELSGKVIIAESGKADSTLIVMLHTNLADSAVEKERPRYITRLDSSGNFHFRNLAPGTFAIYALKDEGAKKYQSRVQLFAFYDSSVTSQSRKNNIMLYAFVAKDTAKKKVSVVSEAAPKKGKEPPKNLRIQSSASNGQQDLLTTLEINATDSLINYDSTKIRFFQDSATLLTKYTLKRDSTGKKITLQYAWTESTNYTLIIDTTFATDTSGRRLAKTDTLAFTSKRASEYGLVRLRFPGLELNKNPLLQFIQGTDIKYIYVLKNKEFSAKLFNPGEYELRLVYDTNKNGLWDTGEFFIEHLQPEKVRLIPRKINVKANWDNEVDIQL